MAAVCGSVMFCQRLAYLLKFPTDAHGRYGLRNGAMHMGMKKATESDQTLSVSPVLSMHGQWERVDDGTGENGEGRVPLLEGDGTHLTDVNGQLLYEEPGWRLLRDQASYALCDNDGNLCFEEVDEN